MIIISPQPQALIHSFNPQLHQLHLAQMAPRCLLALCLLLQLQLGAPSAGDASPLPPAAPAAAAAAATASAPALLPAPLRRAALLCGGALLATAGAPRDEADLP